MIDMNHFCIGRAAERREGVVKPCLPLPTHYWPEGPVQKLSIAAPRGECDVSEFLVAALPTMFYALQGAADRESLRCQERLGRVVPADLRSCRQRLI
jgi:hypothetical protein